MVTKNELRCIARALYEADTLEKTEEAKCVVFNVSVQLEKQLGLSKGNRLLVMTASLINSGGKKYAPDTGAGSKSGRENNGTEGQ